MSEAIPGELGPCTSFITARTGKIRADLENEGKALIQVTWLVPRRTTPALETCSVLGLQSCVGVHVPALSLSLLLPVMPGESSRT